MSVRYSMAAKHVILGAMVKLVRNVADPLGVREFRPDLRFGRDELL